MSTQTKPRIFIDGQAGTTGLQIAQRLAARDDLEVLVIAEEERKSEQARAALMERSDLTLLCLPDSAVPAAVALASARCRVLDASSVHRTATGWVYGLPELGDEQRQAIAGAERVSNPGCYPQGFILLLRPLLEAGWIDANTPRSMHAASGYSGGGRTLIERYQSFSDTQAEAYAVCSYALGLSHKHVPEMQHYCGLTWPPLFSPSVGNYYQGMLDHVPVHSSELRGGQSLADVESLLVQTYSHEPFVRVVLNAAETATNDGFLDPSACNHSNMIELMVFGNEDQLLLVARYDNLGKGAAGCAVQNLNLMLGFAETAGLQQ
ncbi:MAG: N-acetyl-gamma-glutamyl-phosphate reductase [Pseudomonadales bacterium]